MTGETLKPFRMKFNLNNWFCFWYSSGRMWVEMSNCFCFTSWDTAAAFILQQLVTLYLKMFDKQSCYLGFFLPLLEFQGVTFIIIWEYVDCRCFSVILLRRMSGLWCWKKMFSLTFIFRAETNETNQENMFTPEADEWNIPN